SADRLRAATRGTDHARRALHADDRACGDDDGYGTTAGACQGRILQFARHTSPAISSATPRRHFRLPDHVPAPYNVPLIIGSPSPPNRGLRREYGPLPVYQRIGVDGTPG